MNKKTILILGGYGGVGKSLSRLMLKVTNVDLVIAGHRKEKAKQLADILNNEFSGHRVSYRYAVAQSDWRLERIFTGSSNV